MVRRLLPLIAATLLVGVLAAPARAIQPFGPPVEVIDPPCTFDFFSGDAVRDSGENSHGFAQFFGGGCGGNPAIHYFEGDGASFLHEPTPYVGEVLAAAWDDTGSYLLYNDRARGVRIAKRLSDGTYTPGRTLSSAVVDQVVAVQGDLVAANGEWWAVWNEQVGPGGEFAQTDLFEGRTIGSLVNRQRITTSPQPDLWPSLALTPGQTFPLTMVWERAIDEFTADLRIGQNATLRWDSRPFATNGSLNTTPDVQVVGVTTHVTWWRDQRIVVADDAGTGTTFSSHTFNLPGFIRPRFAESAGVLFVGWTRALRDSRTFVAAKVSGVWSGTHASPSVPGRDQYLFGLVPRGGKGSALNVSLTSRLYATSET
jgi:hypothetical protein